MVSLILLVYRWIDQKRNSLIQDDYYSKKPPLYVHYYTSRMRLPFSLYLMVSFWVSIIIFLIVMNILNNALSGFIMGGIVFYYFIQFIVSRSIRLSQKMDEHLPIFLHAFYNIFSLNNDPIFSLKYALKSADKSFKKPLEDLSLRLENNDIPSDAISKTKLLFKNKVFEDFLSSFEDVLYRGYGFENKLGKLISRADKRRQFAVDRRVETFGAVYLIRVGSLIFLIVAVSFFVIKPHYFLFYKTNMLGQLSIDIMAAILGVMSIMAQRLMLLSEN